MEGAADGAQSIDRLEGSHGVGQRPNFFGHCRMEQPWDRFDFAVDVTEVYEQKLAALATYESVFSGDQEVLLQRYASEDRYVGSLVGVRYAEPFRARRPLLFPDPTVFLPVRYG